MSNTVDERVVEMRFDNKQFEKGANQTIDTLDKLDKSLDLKGAGKSFKDLEKAASNVDLSDLTKSIDGIGGKFSAMGVIGKRVLENLTDKLFNFGERFVKSLSTDQITAGWSKYEAKTEAVQVIMHATHETIDTVNESLEKLLKFTDETSYNFSDMVGTISKFTSAGLKLTDAEQAVEGIANWAATAGVGIDKAQSAFYNLSQAMSTGALKVQDWKSIELLNMSTNEFKDKAIEIAQAMIDDGRASAEMKAAFNKAKPTVDNFRESMSTGWIDKNVLTETLKAYSDLTTEFGRNAFKAAQEAKTWKDAVGAAKDAVSTGWMNVFEDIFGNYEEAKVFWTDVAVELAEAFTVPTTSLHEFFAAWHEGGGYVAFIESIGNAWQAVKSIVESVGESFKNVFPAMSVEKFITATERFRDLTAAWKDATTKVDVSDILLTPEQERLLESQGINFRDYKRALKEADSQNQKVDKNMKPLVDTFEGLFSVLSLIKTVITSAFKIVAPFTKLISPIMRTVISITGIVGKLLTGLVDFITESLPFKFALSLLEKGANAVANAFKWVADNLGKFFSKLESSDVFLTFVGAVNKVRADLVEMAGPLFKDLRSGLDYAWNWIKDFTKTTLGITIESVADAFLALGTVIAGFVSQAITALTPAWNWIKVHAEMLWEDYIKKYGGMAIGFLMQQYEKIKRSGFGQYITEHFTKITNKIRELADSLKKHIQEGGIAGVLDWLKEKWRDLYDTIRGLNFRKLLSGAFVAAKFTGALGMLITILKVGQNLGKITGFIKKLGNSIRELTKGMAVKRVAMSLLMLAGALLVLSKIESKDLGRVGLALGIMAAGLVGLVLAMTAISGIIAKKGNVDMKAMAMLSIAVVAMAGAMLIIAIALGKLKSVDKTELLSYAGILTGILAFLVIGMAALSLAGKGIKSLGIGLLLIVAAVAIVAIALARLKDRLSEIQYQKDLMANAVVIMISIGLILFALSLALKKTEKAAFEVAALITAAGVAMFLMSLAVEKLGKMEWTSLGKGILALAVLVGAIVALGLAMKLFDGGSWKGLLSLAAAMIALGMSAAVLVAAILVLGSISSEQAATGIKRLAQIIVMIMAATATAGFAKAKAGGFLGLAAVIITIVAALWFLTTIPLGKLRNSVKILGSVFASLGASMALMNSTKALKGKNWSSILATMGVIAAIGAALWWVSTQVKDPKMLAATAAAMGHVLRSLGVAFAISGKALSVAKAGPLLGMAGVIVAIGGAMWAIGQLDIAHIVASTAALELLIPSVVGAVMALSYAKTSHNVKDIGKQILTTIGVLAPIIGALWALSAITGTYGMESMAMSVAALGILIPSVVGAVMALSYAKVPSNWSDILKIAGFITAVLTPIVLALASMQWMHLDANRVVGYAEALSAVINALTIPLLAIMAFSLLGGGVAGGAVVAGAAWLGAALGVFVIIVGLIIALVAGIDELLTGAGVDAVAKINRAGEILTAIGTAVGGMFGGFIGEVLGGAMEGIGDKLPDFGTKISDFLSNMAPGLQKFNGVRLSESSANAISTLAGALVKLTANDALSKISEWLFGEGMDMDKFATDMGKLGTGLKSFATETEGIDGEAVKPAAEALDALVGVLNNMPKEDGFIQKIIGNTMDLSDFINEFVDSIGEDGEKVNGIASNLLEMAEAFKKLKDADIKAIEDAAHVMQLLADVAGSMYKTGGAWQKITGEHMDLGKFMAMFADQEVEITDAFGNVKTEKIPGIGTNLHEYANAISQVTPEDLTHIEESAQVFQALAKVGESIQDKTTTISAFFGLITTEIKSTNTQGFSDMLTSLSTLGEEVGMFTSVFTSDVTDKLSKTGLAFQDLVNAELALATRVEAGQKLVEFSQYLATMASSLAGTSVSLSLIDYGGLDALLAWLETQLSTFPDKGTAAIDDMLAAMVNDASTKATTTVDDILKSFSDEMGGETVVNKFKQAGWYMVEGIVHGINEKLYLAASAGSNLSNAIINKLRELLLISSPSRVTRQIGEYVGEGFVLGISDWVGKAANESSDLANAAINAVTTTLDYIQQIMDGDLSVDMRIHPVLDLEDMRGGVSQINNMFSRRQAVMAQIGEASLSESNEITELLAVSKEILHAIQNGSEIYLDGKVLAGSVNRRLGKL